MRASVQLVIHPVLLAKERNIVRWSNLPPEASAIQLSTLGAGWSDLFADNFLWLAKGGPFVFLEPHVKRKIMRQLRGKKVEMGGLLVGNVISKVDLENGILAVNVTDAVESRRFESTSGSLSMDSCVWSRANSKSAEGEFVVGWYHSHPNLGAFFSFVDRETHSKFFCNSYSLALVVDPFRDDEKWFYGRNAVELPRNKVLTNLDLVI